MWAAMTKINLAWLCWVACAGTMLAGVADCQRQVAVEERLSSNTRDPRPGFSFPVFRYDPTNSPPPRERRNLLGRRRVDEGSNSFHRTVPVEGTHEKMGYFYSIVNIGTPPQSFGVILDTGSTIMSVPCENCTHCGTHLDPVFNVSASSTAVDTGKPFSQSYTEGSSLHGTYIEDVICIGNCTNDVEKLRFQFGCANRMTNLFRTQLADGIMGMANDTGTFLSHLMADHRVEKELFTLCLAYQGGRFGVGTYSTANHWSSVLWTPLSKNSIRRKFYYISTLTFLDRPQDMADSVF